MKKIYFFITILFVSLQNLQSQQLKLSVYSEISIITVGPGDALFEAFGHSAIRVKDPLYRMDIVFNYGLFDFNQPNFYINFTKGKLVYKLGKTTFKRFVASNQQQERWMESQVLNLSQLERQKMFDFLEINALTQNADYLYDPFFNNCATKLRDITIKVLGDNVQFPSSYSNKEYTLRQLMNHEIHWNTWGNFGINLALGNKLDQKISAKQYMYLPDYVFKAFDKSQKISQESSVSLIKNNVTILDFDEKQIQIIWLNPFFVFSMLLLITIVVTYYDQKKNKRSRWLDFILFFCSGFVGIIISFLWFFTDHSTTPNNFNLLWAFFPNLLVSFLLLKKKIPSRILTYFKWYIILLFIVPILWITGIQEFSIAIIPLLGMLFLRSYYLIKFGSHQ